MVSARPNSVKVGNYNERPCLVKHPTYDILYSCDIKEKDCACRLTDNAVIDTFAFAFRRVCTKYSWMLLEVVKRGSPMTNRLKEKLKAGEPAFGVSVMFPSPQIVEMVGKLGFDWVMIDCEHGSVSPESIETMAMAAELTGITPIARPWTNSAEAILRVMDRGAMGVQVPHVNTADDAKRAVEAVKYYPLGERGLAAGSRPANYGFGLPMSEYVVQANADTLVCVQLEEQEALRNIDEILKVEGVDVFFVGPSDLSQSMGYPGKSSEPVLQQSLDDAF